MQEVVLDGNRGALIRDYDRLLTQYIIVLYDSGLSKLDCIELGRIITKLMKIKQSFEAELKKEQLDLRFYENNPETYKLFSQKTKDVMRSEVLELEENINDLDKLIWDYENIYQFLKREMKPRGIKEFIHEETSLNHLVYTNNKHSSIKLRSISNYRYLCQFHLERTPSLFVNESTSSLFCYGCGIDLDVLEYLKTLENISESKVISLLANVYLFDIGKQKKEVRADLVAKYRSTLLSDDYRSLVEQGYERASNCDNSIERERAILKFEKDMAMIGRVKRGEFLKLELDDGKKLVLKRPDLEEE